MPGWQHTCQPGLSTRDCARYAMLKRLIGPQIKDLNCKAAWIFRRYAAATGDCSNRATSSQHHTPAQGNFDPIDVLNVAWIDGASGEINCAAQADTVQVSLLQANP